MSSGVCAMRQPKWLPPDSGPSWRKITRTASSRGAPSSISRARASEVRPPPLAGSAKRNRSCCPAHSCVEHAYQITLPLRTPPVRRRVTTTCHRGPTMRRRPGFPSPACGHRGGTPAPNIWRAARDGLDGEVAGRRGVGLRCDGRSGGGDDSAQNQQSHISVVAHQFSARL